jgi:hypothetical protein
MYSKRTKWNCKFGCPFLSHIEVKLSLNIETNKWEYYTLCYEDQNVVPFHPTLLILCGAHLNIICITSSYWSLYLLKYAMKCKPHGTLNLNKKNVKRFNLQNASKNIITINI